ncbi:unnamed protein product [Phytomonas sp. Hart1]|nr:unnamed protein product [Phytomonas sp. Hart1]|eukprot:CCW70380.1 unnamed protein product [Phytomonas sp. isolate Hart1]
MLSMHSVFLRSPLPIVRKVLVVETPCLCADKPDLSLIQRLPDDVLNLIFINVIQNEHAIFPLKTLSLVCKRWNALCQHSLIWEVVVKKIFVVYPLVMFLEYDVPFDEPSRGILADTKLLGDSKNSISQSEAVEERRAPTKELLQKAMTAVQEYSKRQQYYKYVQRCRGFVLHLFISASLLSICCAIISAMCAAEDVSSCSICTSQASFSFLWVSYVCIIALIISNIVMLTHFEPLPLFSRIRRNKLLITTSSTVIIIVIFDIIIPTFLIQMNLLRNQRFPWLWCGATIIFSFCVWQGYALRCIMPDAREHLYHQLESLNIRDGFHFLLLNIPNAFPLLFASAAFCALQYVQYGSRLYVLLGGIPVIVSLFIIMLVFLLDYLWFYRWKDLSIAICLFSGIFFPLSLLVWDFRGWSLIPLAISTFGVFLSHFFFVVIRVFRELKNV